MISFLSNDRQRHVQPEARTSSIGVGTVTLDHLRQTAASDVRVKLALRNALESEAEFVETEDADAQLLALLRKPLPHSSSKAAPRQGEQDQPQSPPAPRSQRQGKRAPGRDSIGSKSDAEVSQEPAEEERVAG